MPADIDSHQTGPDGARGSGRDRTFHLLMRDATRTDHDEVDRLFGTLGFANAEAYGHFLTAHARALLPIEAWFHGAPADIAGRVDRGAALRADIAALDLPLPAPEPLDWSHDSATLRGVAYVLEGSRLGGAMLARQVPEGLPRAYLGAVHAPGGWRNFLDAMETEAASMNSAWRERALEGARRAFATFARAARSVGAQ